MLELRLQLERGLEEKRVGDGTMTTRMRVGLDAQMFDGDAVDLTLAGTPLSFDAHDRDPVGRVFVGSDMVRQSDSGATLTAGVEAGFNTNQRVDVSGGVEWVLNF